MDAKDLVVNNSCQRQIIENFCAIAPYIYRAVLSEAFIVETVDLCDLSALVVASNESDSFWVSHLQRIVVN